MDISHRNARSIGYWCRIHGVSHEEAFQVPELQEIIGSAEGQQEFKEGWREAEEELLAEKITALLYSLILK